LSRIFDPFFTTARSRGSTGLGMHIVHNLVTVKLNGRIAVQSEPPRGTIVSVEFPVSLRASEDSDAACLPAEVTST
jgi:signal transduction histidine kinase